MAKLKNKEYILKIYRPGPNGALVDTLTDFSFSGFQKNINGGLGQLTLTLSRPGDNYGEGNLIAENNQVRLYVKDIDSGPEGSLIYNGWIADIDVEISATDRVSVLCYGYIAKLAVSILRDGSPERVIIQTGSALGLQYGKDARATEVTTVVKRIVDLYRANSAQLINYNADTIPANTGVTMTYIFDKQYWLEAIEAARQFAPAGWYYFLDEENNLHFKAKPVTATHTFELGKHFQEVRIKKESSRVANVLLFHSDNEDFQALKKYEDATSKTLHNDRWELKTDNRVKNQSTADAFGNAFVSENKDPKRRTRVIIVDNNSSREGGLVGYNIELINPGDTCRFKGFNEITSQNFTENMTIVEVYYTPESVEIELEESADSTARIALLAERTAEEALGSNGIDVIGTVKEYATPYAITTFSNGWLNYNTAEYQGARYYKDRDGFVHVEGLVKSGNSGQVIFNLPANYRPAKEVIFPAYTNTGFSRVNIQANGDVYLTGGTGWFGLDGIFFSAADAGDQFNTPVFVNNWLNYDEAVYHKAQWSFNERTRLVIPRGLVKSGTVPGAIIKVPDNARPLRNHLFVSIGNGAIARISIQNEQYIWCEAGANNWVTLEGIYCRAGQEDEVIAPTMQNGWLNYSDAWAWAGYWKDDNGIVHLQGLIKSGTVGSAAFTLPDGYRPDLRRLYKTLTDNNVLGRVDVLANGEVQPIVANPNWISLSGIQFLPG